MDREAVDVVLPGATEPAADQLADMLAIDLRRDVDLTLQWTPRTTLRSRGTPPD